MFEKNSRRLVAVGFVAAGFVTAAQPADAGICTQCGPPGD